jgi:pectate lyase
MRASFGIVLALIVLFGVTADAQILMLAGGRGAPPASSGCLVAFPGAEGFGACATGGRGGVVIPVTNLNASGSGSLKAALETTGPRMVVFKVSGVIDCNGTPIEFNYSRRDVSIFAQTSPLGVTTKDCMLRNTATAESGAWPNVFQNFIWQFLTIDNSESGQDSIQLSYCHDFIFDHLTLRGSTDEVLDFTRCRDATVGWTICSNSSPAGQQNCLLAAYRPTDEITIHHLLSAHHEERCWGQWHWDTGDSAPTAPIQFEFVNNLCYNASFQQVLRMDAGGYPIGFTQGRINLMGNTVIAGPNTHASQIVFHADENPSVYNSDNHAPPGGTVIGGFATITEVGSRFVFPNPVTVTSAAQAVIDNLAYSGAIPRDACANTLIQEIMDQDGSPGLCAEALNTATGTAWPDVDSDNCDDTWEVANGLSTASSSDCAAIHSSGYANVERWSHARRAELRASVVP